MRLLALAALPFSVVALAVTLAGLLDDSVRAERWQLGFQQRGEVYALTAALRELRCHRGRGHAGFSPEPCA